MADNFDGYVSCPHCGKRRKAPEPSALTKQHNIKCLKCKSIFVVQDTVEHDWFVASQPPVKLGQLFTLSPDTLTGVPESESDTYEITELYLTVDGWWVRGDEKSLRDCYCYVEVENVVLLEEECKK